MKLKSSFLRWGIAMSAVSIIALQIPNLNTKAALAGTYTSNNNGTVLAVVGGTVVVVGGLYAGGVFVSSGAVTPEIREVVQHIKLLRREYINQAREAQIQLLEQDRLLRMQLIRGLISPAQYYSGLQQAFANYQTARAAAAQAYQTAVEKYVTSLPN